MEEKVKMDEKIEGLLTDKAEGGVVGHTQGSGAGEGQRRPLPAGLDFGSLW